MRKSSKLASKDLIVAGAFAALYVVLLFATVSITGFVPIIYIMAPLILGIVLGPVYMLFVTKVPKRGAIMILAVLVGLVTSMGGVYVSFFWCVAIGFVAEFIAGRGGYNSRQSYMLSYVVFACTGMGPFWLLVIGKQSFLEQCVRYYGESYAQSIDALTPSWIILVFLVLALVGGFIGSRLGSSMMTKHFEKAGVV